MPGKKPPLNITHPEIADDWHQNANNGKTPADVTATSKFEAVWLCHGESQHQMTQRVDYRVSAGGCRFCLTERELAQNNLLIKFPDVARQWHATKNAGLNPQDVPPMAHKKVWWQCDENPKHAWQALISNRTAQDAGCPMCASVVVDESNSLASLRPDIAAQWHAKKNSDLRPSQVTVASNKRVWWSCSEGHSWQAEICSRTLNEDGCPYCGEYYLTDKYRLSVRFPEIAEEWHPTKNRPLWPKIEGNYNSRYNVLIAPEEREYGSRRRLRPSDVFAGSVEEVWWQCRKSSDHVWKATVKSRTSGKEKCPFCAGRKVCSDNNLAVLYPPLARQWHSRNGALLPTQVTPSSQRLVWWRCFKNADHVWDEKVADVVAAYDNGKNPCYRCRHIQSAGMSARESG